MNTSLNLSKEELIAIKHLIEYYKGIELEYMTDEEINIADNLSNKVCLKLREIKDKDFYINGIELEEGKLYKLVNNPNEWGENEMWVFRFDYIQCSTDTTDKLLMSKSCFSLDKELKDIECYNFTPSALCSLSELNRGNFQLFPCNEGEIKAFEYFENLGKKNNDLKGYYLENQILGWNALVNEFLNKK